MITHESHAPERSSYESPHRGAYARFLPAGRRGRAHAVTVATVLAVVVALAGAAGAHAAQRRGEYAQGEVVVKYAAGTSPTAWVSTCEGRSS